MTLTSHRNGITRLRDGTFTRDRAILDALELLEAGLVPGWVGTADLMARWGTSQPQVSRRLAAVNRLGVVRVTREYGRSYLRRPGHAEDDRLWRAAVSERRRLHAIRRRVYRRLEPQRAARWERLRTLVPLITQTHCATKDLPL